MKISYARRLSRHSSVGGGNRCAGRLERGFTLQTLIVTAVLVLVAVAATLVIVAITRSSEDDFREAGNTDLEARCRPNEVWSPEYDARGEAGTNTTFYELEVKKANQISGLDPSNITDAWRTWSEIEAETIGCDPVCGTWEYYDPGRAAARVGGPDGKGGVFSSNIGCFAPCYLRRHNVASNLRLPNVATSGDQHSLHYWDDNRVPPAGYLRLGVVYRRNQDASLPGQTHTDMQYRTPSGGHTPNPYPPRVLRLDARRGNVNPGLPLTSGMLSHSTVGPFGAVGKPDWNGTADDNLEVRADPAAEECTIVDTSDNDSIFCTSTDDRCA